MGLADFFHRDTIAIAQVLQGFDTDAFIESLECMQVAIAFGSQAANSRDGRALIDLSVRLAARLYPGVAIVSTSAESQFADDLMELARGINPNIDLSEAVDTRVGLSIGLDAPAIDAPTVYAGCDGWVARVGTQGPFSTTDVGNPFGAGFAACLAAANMFRFLFMPKGSTLIDTDISFPDDAARFPDVEPCRLSGPLVLVGVGAIGNSVAWALARTPITGQIHLIDPELVELSNLQRYILCEREDEGGIKVEIVGRNFNGSLVAIAHQEDWTSFVTTTGYKWERVMVALDSARDRRAVQGTLPRWIANAWTQKGDLGVSTHLFLNRDACLACLYLPTETSKSEDQIVAEGLRIPQFQPQVRYLLSSGLGVDRAICEAVAAAWNIPVDALERYVGKPIRELWVEGVCGGGVIPLGEAGPTPRELEVPLAFQSALAGVLLAAETVVDTLTAHGQLGTFVRQLDVLRPLGDASRRPLLKAGTGNCICEDFDFIAAYRQKYGS